MSPENKTKLSALCADALAVQGACNLSGVVHSMSRAVSELRGIYPGQSTDFFNTHPVVLLYVDKLQSLAVGGALTMHDAYGICEDFARDPASVPDFQ